MKSKSVFATLLALASLNAFASSEGGSFNDPSAVEVRYANKGGGIDQEAKKQIEGLLAAAKVQGQIKYVKVSDWGMEGESTHCIQFNALSAAIIMHGKIEEIVKSRPQSTTVTLKGDCNEEPIKPWR